MFTLIFFIGIFFVVFGIANRTKNFYSSLLFKIIPFFTGLYLMISQYNIHELYFPIAAGIIGVYFVSFGLFMKSRDFLSRVVYNFLPFSIGLFLILNSLHDLNLI